MNPEHVLALRTAKTIYRDGDAAVKLFDSCYSKADILSEALNLARIEETGLPVPRVREVTKINGRWAIITDFIDGCTLQSLMKAHPERTEDYLARFVDIQLAMHQKTCPMLTKLKDKMNQKISRADLDATCRYELHTRLESMPRHNKVCHGDFHPSNIMITDSGAAYILDWSHATQGNASADAARTYLRFCLEGNPMLAASYLKLFCKKSDTARQYVEAWMPIVAASQSVKGHPEEREFLLSWANIADYE